MTTKYSASEVNKILCAYRCLFPRVGEDLAKYWDYKSEREWSCLTTDFHNVSYERVLDFSEAVRTVDEKEPRARGEALAKLSKRLSKDHKIGFSLGISPWTDDLLLKTYRADRKKIFVILAHDWYPIVTAETRGRRAYAARSPLEQDSIYAPSNRGYGKAMPEIKDAIVLFLNFNPDFRPPLSSTQGPMSRDEECLPGLHALFTSLSAEFQVVGMFSWGGDAWSLLRAHAEPPADCEVKLADCGVMGVEKRGGGEPMRLTLGESGNRRTFLYWAFAHPCRSGNFRQKVHQSAYVHAQRVLQYAVG